MARHLCPLCSGWVPANHLDPDGVTPTPQSEDKPGVHVLSDAEQMLFKGPVRFQVTFLIRST
jgi:hypothetical protein